MNRSTKKIISLLAIWSSFSLLTALPLAVEFLGLSATTQDLSVVLNWSTATETENLGFILEKKTDSLSSWSSLASYINSNALLGQGTVSIQTDYTYADSLVTFGETYYYRISGVDIGNNIGRLDSLSINVGETSIKEIIPIDFNLKAYPNPFNPKTTISYRLTEFSFVDVSIFNTRGLLVEQLENGSVKPGVYNLIWDASNMSTGVYIVKMQVNGIIHSQKLVLLK